MGGFERVFEINRNFRNEGISTQHNPEFTMLEFYQAYSTYDDLMDLTEELFSGLALHVTGGYKVPYGDKEVDLTPPWDRITVKESLMRYCGLSTEELEDRNAMSSKRWTWAWKLVRKTHSGNCGWPFSTRWWKTSSGPVFVHKYPVEVLAFGSQK